MKVARWNILVGGALLGGVAADDLVEPTSEDNSAECKCYLVNGPDAGYFQYHRFWDFRNIPSDDGNDFTVAPTVVSETQNQGNESATSDYLSSAKWQADWSFLGGPAEDTSPVKNIYTPQNVYVSRNSSDGADGSTFLTLRAARLKPFMSSCQIISNQENILHASIRARLRVIPNGLTNSSAPSAEPRPLQDQGAGSNTSHPVDQGAVVGFFTYQSDTEESDIEILTRDSTNQIRYSNQPDYDAQDDQDVPGASSQVTLPRGSVYTDWMEHRLDWFTGWIRWWADGELMLNKSKNAPSVPSGLIVNVWGDGGEWSGNMSVGGQVILGVEWIDMVFNISGHNPDGSLRRGLHKRESGLCAVGCYVDGVKNVGFPEVAFNSTTSTATTLEISPTMCAIVVAAVSLILFA